MSIVSYPKGYGLSGKIMLGAGFVFVGVLLFMLLLHVYARWYFEQMRTRDMARRRDRVNRRTQQVFYYVENDNRMPAPPVWNPNRGLERHVLNSLPVFVYASSRRPTQTQVLECAVCLSEFKDGDRGRFLPKCKHSFHIECIDVWFHSHSTCPLCRSRVEKVPGIRLTMAMESGWIFSAASFGSRGRGLDSPPVRLEVPMRTELENVSAVMRTPASQDYMSAGSRLLSVKKMTSMNKSSPGDWNELR